MGARRKEFSPGGAGEAAHEPEDDDADLFVGEKFEKADGRRKNGGDNDTGQNEAGGGKASVAGGQEENDGERPHAAGKGENGDRNAGWQRQAEELENDHQ